MKISSLKIKIFLLLSLSSSISFLAISCSSSHMTINKNFDKEQIKLSNNIVNKIKKFLKTNGQSLKKNQLQELNRYIQKINSLKISEKNTKVQLRNLEKRIDEKIKLYFDIIVSESIDYTGKTIDQVADKISVDYKNMQNIFYSKLPNEINPKNIILSNYNPKVVKIKITNIAKDDTNITIKILVTFNKENKEYIKTISPLLFKRE